MIVALLSIYDFQFQSAILDLNLKSNWQFHFLQEGAVARILFDVA
jgi:hypothetical protein